MEDSSVELRGPCPREIVDVVDAWSQAKCMTRTQAVNLILKDWALRKLHEHSVFARVTKGNPLLKDAHGERAE
jgi:hypothetical protein